MMCWEDNVLFISQQLAHTVNQPYCRTFSVESDLRSLRKIIARTGSRAPLLPWKR